MESADQLLTVAEITIALAGFSGIVATFQFRQGNRITRGDALGLSIMVNASLVGAFFAVLPGMLSNFGLGDSTVWTISSALMAVNYTVFIGFIATRLRQVRVYRKARGAIFAVFFVVATVVGLANVFNALDVVFHREFGPYFVAMVVPSITVGFMFSTLLLRPMWRTIRVQNARRARGERPA